MKSKEEIFQDLSDSDLEFALKEIRDISESEKKVLLSGTIMLYEIYNDLMDIKVLNQGKEYVELCMYCGLEYSYRKMGLK